MQEKLLPQSKQVKISNAYSCVDKIQANESSGKDTKVNQSEEAQIQFSATTQSQIYQNFLSEARYQQLSNSSGNQEIPLHNDQDKQSKRVYSRVTDDQRQMFIKLVTQEKIQIRQAADMAGIGYENSKSILKVYKKEGRQHTLLFKDQVIKRKRKKVLRVLKTPKLPISISSCSKDDEIINNIIIGVHPNRNQHQLVQKKSLNVRILIPKQHQQQDRKLPLPESMSYPILREDKMLQYGIPVQVNPFMFK